MLADVLEQLRTVQRSIPLFDASAQRPQLPVLDDSQDAQEDKEPIQGLANFKDRVKSEIEFVSKVRDILQYLPFCPAERAKRHSS